MNLQIGRFELDGSRRVLLCDGREVAASGLALALLCELATQPDAVVPYAQLRAVLWPGVAVEESALRRVVRDARRLLGDDEAAARALVTVRGRGLRLARDAVGVAEVESALLRLDDASGPDRSERCDARDESDGRDGLAATQNRIELAEAAAAAGRADVAAPAFRRVAAAALANGWAVLLARATRGLAGPYVRYRPPDPELVARLEQALAALGPADDAWRAQLLIRLATEQTLGDLRQRRALQRAAFAAAERSGDPHALAAVLLEPYGQVEEAVAPSRRDAAIDRCAAAAASLTTSPTPTPTPTFTTKPPALVASARATPDASGADLAFAAALLQLDRALATGALDRFDAIYDEVEQRARRDGRLLWRWGVALRAAQRALLAGRFADAERSIEAAFALGQKLEHGQALELFLAQSLVLRVEQGRAQDLAALRPLLGRDHPSDSARCLVAWALLATGDREEARRLALPLLSHGAAALALQPTAIANAALLVELSAELGEPRAAAALDAVLAPHSGRNVLRGVLACHGPVDRYRALAAGLRGDFDTAWRHSDAALALAHRMEATPCCARIHLDRARLLAVRGRAGDAARARVEAESAQRLAEGAGIETLAIRAARGFVPTPDEPPAPASVRA